VNVHNSICFSSIAKHGKPTASYPVRSQVSQYIPIYVALSLSHSCILIAGGLCFVAFKLEAKLDMKLKA